MIGGKHKAVTFSFDDGVTQDQRLISLLNKYQLKATFNLNSGLLGRKDALIREDVTVSHVKPRACEIRRIYDGHEVAAHTLTHPMLTEQTDEEIIRQVEQDRLALSELIGYEVVGMAYPGGGVNFSAHVANVIRTHTGIRYARTTVSSYSFDRQQDLFVFRPTVKAYKEWEETDRLIDRFLASEGEQDRIFYIWSHAYEYDIHNEWDRLEQMLKRLSGHRDVFYGTNREVLLDI